MRQNLNARSSYIVFKTEGVRFFSSVAKICKLKVYNYGIPIQDYALNYKTRCMALSNEMVSSLFGWIKVFSLSTW
jgi:hypothetical protein